MKVLFPALALLHGGSFSWTRFDVHWTVLIGTALWTAAYLYAVGPLRRRFGWADEVEPKRVAAFVGGSLIWVLALNGPLHDLSDNYLFSAHMVQHLLLMMVVAPLWIHGVPPWLYAAALQDARVRAVARFLTHPITAFAVYNAVFAGWHVPALYEAALENHNLHIVQHLMFMFAAVLMWWPAMDPVPELSRMSSPLRLLYLFMLGIPMSVVSALITMGSSVLYPWYAVQPRVSWLSPLDDQQLGGLIMWVPGGIVFWIAISVIFFRWATREERDEERNRIMVPLGRRESSAAAEATR